jgi:hypothetical protein
MVSAIATRCTRRTALYQPISKPLAQEISASAIARVSHAYVGQVCPKALITLNPDRRASPRASPSNGTGDMCLQPRRLVGTNTRLDLVSDLCDLLINLPSSTCSPRTRTCSAHEHIQKTCCPMMMSRQADCRQLCWRIIGKTSATYQYGDPNGAAPR